jgi:hypothetical protein
LGGRGQGCERTQIWSVTDASGIEWWGIFGEKKVVVLDREEGRARDEEDREARRRQMAWTCNGVIFERRAESSGEHEEMKEIAWDRPLRFGIVTPSVRSVRENLDRLGNVGGAAKRTEPGRNYGYYSTPPCIERSLVW